jgi:hypothetical protein
MSAYPESDLQTKIKQWTGENVLRPHFFFAVDRRQKSAQFSHSREKMRGHVSGTPDTVLLVPGFPAITVELKAKGKKPEPGGDQEKVGAVIRQCGHHWDWTDTVTGYFQILRDIGVPMGNRAVLSAEAKDAILEGAAIKREEAKTGVVSKRRYAPVKAKPSKAHLRKVEQGRWF